ncbi:MAG: hypothetical protein IPH82_16905 [Chloroflexi bacterium]|nr:hypothetical protein [Chloroflexota bacterium]
MATLFFIAMCLWADQRGAAKLSGFALAIAILLKIFLTVLLIWFLWQKKNRTIIWFAVSITQGVRSNKQAKSQFRLPYPGSGSETSKTDMTAT